MSPPRPLPAAGEPQPSSAPAAAPPAEELARLPLDVLQRGRYQPRIDMRPETLEELAASIRAQGVVQPIVVRPLAAPAAGESQRYEIVAGERRWRAAQIAGLADIPAVIRRIPDEAAIAVALIENIQRESLNPLEEARALARLITEFELTHAQAAEAVGRSRAAVSNLLRLLELAPEVGSLLERRELEMGHARALLALSARRQQAEVAAIVAKKSLSVRETEALVRRMQQRGKEAEGAAANGGAGAGRPGRSPAGAGARRQARGEGPDSTLAGRQGKARGELQQPRRARRNPRSYQLSAGSGHCAAQSLLRASPGRPSMATRATHASHPARPSDSATCGGRARPCACVAVSNRDRAICAHRRGTFDSRAKGVWPFRDGITIIPRLCPSIGCKYLSDKAKLQIGAAVSGAAGAAIEPHVAE